MVTESDFEANRYGRYHHCGSDNKCSLDCPGCERRGLQARVKFTESFETVVALLRESKRPNNHGADDWNARVDRVLR